MKSPSIRLLSLIVLTLGLISCTANRNPAPNLLEDSWSLPAPLISNPEGLRGVSSSQEAALSIESEIVFPFPDQESVEQVTFDTRSSCRTSTGFYESQEHFRKTARISAANLIPLQLLRSDLYLENLEGDSCSIEITGRNQYGSTHKIRLPSITLKKLSLLETLDIPKVIEAKSAKSLLSDLMLKERDFEVDLICEQFRNHRTSNEFPSFHDLLDSLVNGSINPVSKKFIEPRNAFSLQKCRFIVAATNSITSQRQIHLSPLFTLQYPRSRVSASASIGFDYDRVDSNRSLLLSGMRFLKTQITNQSQSPIAFLLPNTFANLFFQPALLFDGKIYRGDTYQARLSLLVQGGHREWRRDEGLFFEIPPGETVSIEGTMDTPLSCQLLALTAADSQTSVGRSLFAGFSYSLEQDLTPYQLLNWNPHNPDFTQPREALSSLGLAMKTEKGGSLEMPSNWDPTPGWIQHTGTRARPPTIHVPPMLMEQCSRRYN